MKPENLDKPVILFKYGGNAMINEDLKKRVLRNICSLKDKGYHIIIVHGGGPFIQEALTAAQIESEFIDGHRKTTREAFEHVEMALKGKVNGNLVNIINAMSYKAVGLSGKDGQLVQAKKRQHQQKQNGKMIDVDLGQVGNVDLVNPKLIKLLLANDFIPVLTCLAADENGNGYNINADMFAGHIAGELEAEQYIVLTDVDGLRKDKDDPASLIHKITIAESKQLEADKIIQGGMIPKIESCQIALKKGAASARIINGTAPEQILEIADTSVGTLITK